MAKQTLNIEVQKESYELAKALYEIVKVSKKALSDGWQPGEDIPMILTQSLSHLLPAVDGMDKVSAEYMEDKAAFLRSMMIPMSDVAALFMKEEESPA